MKKFKLNYLLGLGMIAGILASCAPAESIDPDNDVNPDGKYTVNYGVQVVPVGDIQRGANNATVTIQTQNGVTTKTVGQDGIAVFENIAAGTVSGYVSSPGFASVNFKSTISFQNVDVNTNGYVSSTVYIPARNADMNGRVYGDYDQDFDFTLTDNGNFQVVDMMVKYSLAGYPMGAGDGALSQVSLDYNSYAVSSDIQGTFGFTQLATTDQGHWSAVLRMEDVSITDGATDVQTIFNVGNIPVALPAGETVEMGDVYAF